MIVTERVSTAPEDSYLELLGDLAYGVASLEWTVLGDLPLLQDRLPAALSLEQLQTGGALRGSRYAAYHLPASPASEESESSC